MTCESCKYSKDGKCKLKPMWRITMCGKAGEQSEQHD